MPCQSLDERQQGAYTLSVLREQETIYWQTHSIISGHPDIPYDPPFPQVMYAAVPTSSFSLEISLAG